jgi:hypothetical protein
MFGAALGWVGTMGTFGAYVLLSRGLWHATSVRYAALNGVAGLLGAIGSSLYGAWPSVVSNVLWSGVAAHSILLTCSERRGVRRADLGQPNTDPEPRTADVLVLTRAA